MKIAIAPDSYEGSLSISEVAQTIEKGLWEIFPDAQYVPILVTDGGKGTAEVVIAATQGSERHAWAIRPPGEKMNASWGVFDDDKTAFIETAAASGLELVSAERCGPLVTASRGTGELILQALENGATNVIISTGGNATNDGGAGMVQALGAKSCDANGNEIGFGSGSSNTLDDIDISGLDSRLEDCVIRVACDVTNPLVGDNGTLRILGLQKGVNGAMIVELDNDLSHYAEVTKKALHVDVKGIPGAGTAGDMGAALMAFLGMKLKSGIEIATTALNLEEHIHDCTPVIAGKGCIDSQSIHRGVLIGVINMTKGHRKPVIGIAGSLTGNVGVVYQHGIDVVFSVLTNIGTLDKVFHRTYDNICRTLRSTTATLMIGVHNAG